MTSADVRVQVFDTDAVTWRALAQVFDVTSADGEGGRHEWIELRDLATDVQVTFFKSAALEVLDAAAEVEPVPPGPALVPGDAA